MTVDLMRIWLRPTAWDFLALLVISGLLAALACADDDGSTPAASNPTVDQLRENAEEFEYAIGQPGGTLTLATIGEPLTLNLAIANDASSSGILGILFEGLTETSLANRPGRARAGGVLGTFG